MSDMSCKEQLIGAVTTLQEKDAGKKDVACRMGRDDCDTKIMEGEEI